MKLILWPATPPCSFTMPKNVLSNMPSTPYEEAGPLYGTVLPILISVAVTPGVSAAVAAVATSATSAVAARNVFLPVIEVLSFSHLASATVAVPGRCLQLPSAGGFFGEADQQLAFLHAVADAAGH